MQVKRHLLCSLYLNMMKKFATFVPEMSKTKVRALLPRASLIYQNQKQDSKSCFCFSVLFGQNRNTIPNQVNHAPFMFQSESKSIQDGGIGRKRGTLIKITINLQILGVINFFSPVVLYCIADILPLHHENMPI